MAKGTAAKKGSVQPHGPMPAHRNPRIRRKNSTLRQLNRHIPLIIRQRFFVKNALTPLAMHNLLHVFNKEFISALHVQDQVDGLRRRKPELKMMKPYPKTYLAGLRILLS